MPSLDSCEVDPCEEAVPLPMTGQTGYLRADGFALVEQTALPSFEDVEQYKPAECHTQTGGTFAWALRDAPGGAGPGRVRALLLARCGLAEGREGTYTAGRMQLLVYGDDGRLELTAGDSSVGLLDWTRGTKGPKLAGAQVFSDAFGAGDLVVEAAVPIAAK